MAYLHSLTPTFLVWFEDQREAVVIAPHLSPVMENHQPVLLGEVLQA